jgi:ABC-type transporter Mla subunit MlaD
MKTKITEINTLFAGSVAQLSIEDKAKLKTLTKETQDLVKSTHQILNDAVKSLKEAVKIKLETAKPAEENNQ